MILLIFINLLLLTVARGQFNPYLCTPNGNYTSNSTYAANLNSLLNSLSSNMANNGYYSSSLGAAYALALCRTDQTVEQCRECVGDAAPELLGLCENQRQGAMWYDFCLVRYSNVPLNKTSGSYSGFILRNSQNVSEGNKYFREDILILMADLRVQAAQGSSLLKVGVGSRPISGVNQSTIYALVQCTPDLLSDACLKCLADSYNTMLRVVEIARGVRMLDTNCILRYELYLFYNETRLRELLLLPLLPPLTSPPLPPSPTATVADNPRGNKNSTDTKRVAMIIVPISVCLTLAACAVIFLRKRRKQQPNLQDITETIDEISSVESLQYELAQIITATANFDDSKRLGQGGFGAVYKGTLFNGQEIAVKRLSENSGQGNTEFKNEVLLVARLQHRNLVRLLGFCLEGTERLLVYELVQNASLDQFIFDPDKRSCLDWDTRYKIIGGVARGLLYLHEDSRLRIIHRDLKASNVLLDGDMNPKIADFGMARLSRHDEIQGNTNKIVGTYGYMAPEYAMHGEFSIKSDVFSFGVLILEIISGQRNHVIRHRDNMEDLLTVAWGNWQRGAAEDMIDPLLLLKGRSSISKMLKCIHIGLLCVQEKAANRPTMNSVVHMLNAPSSALPLPSEPAFYMGSRFDPKAALIQESADSGSSQNEMSATELYAR